MRVPTSTALTSEVDSQQPHSQDTRDGVPSATISIPPLPADPATTPLGPPTRPKTRPHETRTESARSCWGRQRWQLIPREAIRRLRPRALLPHRDPQLSTLNIFHHLNRSFPLPAVSRSAPESRALSSPNCTEGGARKPLDCLSSSVSAASRMTGRSSLNSERKSLPPPTWKPPELGPFGSNSPLWHYRHSFRDQPLLVP